MTNTKPTPTPWENISEGISGYTILHKENLHEIARVNPTYHYDEIQNDKENADLIVRAVNSHEALYLFAEKVSRSTCLDQKIGDKCICFSCEAKRVLYTIESK